MIKFGITIKCTHFSAKQNNKTTENGRENECSLNTTSLGEETTQMPVSSNVVNHTPLVLKFPQNFIGAAKA